MWRFGKLLKIFSCQAISEIALQTALASFIVSRSKLTCSSVGKSFIFNVKFHNANIQIIFLISENNLLILLNNLKRGSRIPPTTLRDEWVYCSNYMKEQYTISYLKDALSDFLTPIIHTAVSIRHYRPASACWLW